MSRPSVRPGTGEDIVMILRHFSDPASHPQQRYMEKRSSKAQRGGHQSGNGVESDRESSTWMSEILNAQPLRLQKFLQELFRDVICVLSAGALKFSLCLVTILRAFFACLCCFRGAGKVGLLTRRYWALSNLSFQLNSVWRERKAQKRLVAEFLRRHQISTLLSIRMLKHLNWLQPQQVRPKDPEKVRRNAMTLISEILEEMGAPPLMEHPFFRSFRNKHPKLQTQLCNEALVPIFHSGNEIVFTVGESCSMMYIIVNGSAQYAAQLPPPRDAPVGTAGTQVRKTLHSGHWLSEAALWTGWVHRGELRTLCDCLFFGLEAGWFARVISSQKSAHAFAASYARKFVEGLNRSIQSDITEAGPVD